MSSRICLHSLKSLERSSQQKSSSSETVIAMCVGASIIMTLPCSEAGFFTRSAGRPPRYGEGGEDLERVVGKIRSELVTLQQRRTQICKRTATVRAFITGLAEVFGETAIPQELHSSLVVRRQGFKRHSDLAEL